MSGIIGVYSKNRKDVANVLYYGLYALQHRGQATAGMAVNDNGYIDYAKDFGLAQEVFDKNKLERLKGNIGIGHIGQSVTNVTSTSSAEPLVFGYRAGALGLVYDGGLINANDLKDKLINEGVIFQSQIETEIIANLIARHHSDDIEQAIIKAIKDMQGSYALVTMTSDRLIGVRDPYGLKPLCIGKLGNDYVLSSETCAFDTIGAEYVRDVEPGEMVVIIDGEIKSVNTKKREKKSICLFEVIYYARPDSKLDERSIYLIRRESGRQLAEEYRNYPATGDIVISAPDSGTVAAIGYAEESKIPYDEGLIKNRYVGRTFIQPTQEMREQGVKIKLNVLKENVEGRRVILVDDSIVRGTTMKGVVKMLKKAGASEVHVRISAPAVKYKCIFGMHTARNDSLIAAEKTKEEIKDILNADSLEYLSLEGLLESAGGSEYYCTGCFTGEYPMDEDCKACMKGE